MNAQPVCYIPCPPLFSFAECLWYLDRNFDDCLHEIQAGKLRKLLRIAGEKVLVEIQQENYHLEVVVLSGKLTNVEALQIYISDWFDLGRDLKPFYALLSKDADFSLLAERYAGLRLVGIPDLWEAMCWSVIGQQINLTFAYRLKRRLVEQYGDSMVHADKTYYLFPEPSVISEIDPESLRPFQYSAKKAEYLVGIAGLFQRGEISKAQIQAIPEHAEQLRKLTAIRGIGEWSAEYTLMKSLKHQRSIPFGDAGLNNALFQLKGIPKKDNRKAVEAIFHAYAGWEAYLVFYLWRHLSAQ